MQSKPAPRYPGKVPSPGNEHPPNHPPPKRGGGPPLPPRSARIPSYISQASTPTQGISPLAAVTPIHTSPIPGLATANSIPGFAAAGGLTLKENKGIQGGKTKILGGHHSNNNSNKNKNNTQQQQQSGWSKSPVKKNYHGTGPGGKKWPVKPSQPGNKNNMGNDKFNENDNENEASISYSDWDDYDDSEPEEDDDSKQIELSISKRLAWFHFFFFSVFFAFVF